MRVRFTPEARLAVREKRTWWEQHREKAPRLFVEELAAVVAKCDAALRELGQLVSTFPSNTHYRCAFAFGLAANRRHADALAQAQRVERDAPQSHSVHFNLGQVYSLVGDSESARRHFKIAIEVAPTEQDRADAMEFLNRETGER